MFEIGQKVRISENAFPNSDYPADITARGKIVTVEFDLGDGTWECFDDEGESYPLLESEMEPVE